MQFVKVRNPGAVQLSGSGSGTHMRLPSRCWPGMQSYDWLGWRFPFQGSSFMWLLSVDLNFSPHRPFHRATWMPSWQGSWLFSEWLIRERIGESHSAVYDQVYSIHHHFCLILFIRSWWVSAAHIQEEGIKLHFLKGRSSKILWICIKTITLYIWFHRNDNIVYCWASTHVIKYNTN